MLKVGQRRKWSSARGKSFVLITAKAIYNYNNNTLNYHDSPDHIYDVFVFLQWSYPQVKCQYGALYDSALLDLSTHLPLYMKQTCLMRRSRGLNALR